MSHNLFLFAPLLGLHSNILIGTYFDAHLILGASFPKNIKLWMVFETTCQHGK
jgi:hypothetical protein